MSRVTRCISMLGVIAIVVVVVGLAACGGASGGGAVVAQVGGSSISKATLDHWTRVEAVLAYKVIPRQPVPSGVVPDPPSYTACIAYLAAAPKIVTPQPVKGQPKPTTAQLTTRCRQRYEELQRKALGILIDYYWINGEVADQGVKVTGMETQKSLESFVHKEFPNETEFHKYLTYTGMSVSDVLFIMRDTILTTKLQRILEKVGKGLTGQQQQQQAVLKFAKEFQKHWTARTNCHTGYVVPYCKQYKGPETPA